MNRKRLLSVLLALVMVLSLFSVAAMGETAESGKTVVILHTNDSHGRIYQVDGNNTGMIGIDKVAAVKKSVENSILVDAGDTIHGLPIANMNNGLNVLELMAAAGYSVMTPGNHDFNYGSARLAELSVAAAGLGLDIISANVQTNTGSNFLKTTKIVEVDGVKVGFFGLTSLETPILTSPAGVANVKFMPYKAVSEKAIADLKTEGADVIVALTHISRPEIVALIGELDVKPDLIIEGHDHLFGTETVDGVVISGAGQYQENIGKVTVVLTGDGLDISAEYITKEDLEEAEGDADVKELAEAKKAAVEAQFSAVVAKSAVTLSSARGADNGEELGVRNSEQPLGNLVTDAMRIIGGADVAVTNGGGLRADIREGEITRGDINAVLPFGNVLVIKEATPKALKEILENGLSSLPLVNGRFPQVSGLVVVFDADKEAGDRVVSITIGDKELDLSDGTTKYKLATNDFMAAGGDGYEAIAALSTVAEVDALDTVLENYIASLGGTITAETAAPGGRIKAFEAAVVVEETEGEPAVVEETEEETEEVVVEIVEVTPVPLPAPLPTFEGFLVEGSVGVNVLTLQQMLNASAKDAAAALKEDSIFGPLTKAAVVAFQTEYGLSPDGVVGPLTWGKLFELTTQ
ncbi:MAG: 5'-nucleotidase C-terminal domain-containing protein [Oscillospiraceae bacterium]|nr:5'-nucleotidase C-terminal domain-containing protein [Oscillospiraceae bacterium]